MQNTNKPKRTPTLHQYYSILASKQSTSGFSFYNSSTTSTSCVQQTAAHSCMATNTIQLTAHNSYSKPVQTNTGTSGNNNNMTPDEVRKLYDKAWEWFKSPNKNQPLNHNPIKM